MSLYKEMMYNILNIGVCNYTYRPSMIKLHAKCGLYTKEITKLQ